MDKTKRKGQALNLKRYWIRYSLLAIMLLIPFRIVGEPLITTIIYGLVFCAVALAILRFVRKYGWRRWVLIPMVVCLMLPIVQGYQNTKWNRFCRYQDHNALLERVNCTRTSLGLYPLIWADYLVLKHTNVGIQSSFSYFIHIGPF